MAFDWREKLEHVPHEPGVYLMHDRKGTVVYVGKAKDLHARLRSYFQGTGDTRFFVASLEATLGDIETILTRTAKEALLLENHLIKKHQPRFNVRLKDDKAYLTLRIDTSQRYPRVDVVRKRDKDGALYFGPYHSARAIRETLRLVHRYFQVRSCTDNVFRTRRRPCLQHQIGRCPAPCVLPVPDDEYRARIEEVRLFLDGRGRDLLDGLRRDMRAAADRLDFERAARRRDQVAAIERSLQSQVVDLGRAEDVDALGLHREGAEVTVQVVQIRSGLLTSSRAFHFSDRPVPSDELMVDFLLRYYDGGASIPDVVLVPQALEDEDVHAEWLTERRGRRVEIRTPQRGRYRSLAELVEKNAAQAFEERRSAADDRARVLAGLQQKLALQVLPQRIECYDISQMQGGQAVGSRVVVTDGEPDKSQYRHYHIRAVPGQNDFAMMYEVLRRRFQPSRGAPDPYPQLLVVDGGIGQLNVARAVLSDLGVEGVELASLAKSRVLDAPDGRRRSYAGFQRPTDDEPPVAADGELPDDELDPETAERVDEAAEGDSGTARAPERSPERVFLPGRKNPVVLRANSSELYLLQRLRDEAHRFAITFHRQTRTKRTLGSEVETIPGVGPARRRQLLVHFGSVKRLREADLAALLAVPGLPATVARRVHAHLHPDREPPPPSGV